MKPTFFLKIKFPKMGCQKIKKKKNTERKRK